MSLNLWSKSQGKFVDRQEKFVEAKTAYSKVEIYCLVVRKHARVVYAQRFHFMQALGKVVFGTPTIEVKHRNQGI